MATAVKRFGSLEKKYLAQVIDSGVFCDHPDGFIQRFERAFEKKLEARHAVAGATAMVLMHAVTGAIGAGAGDEIICDPIVQFHGIACLHGNVIPVWTDVRAEDFLMDPDKVEAKITSRTKAIWVTHLWGFPAEVDKLRKIADRHGIYLLEDCAHAMYLRYKGKYVGNWGHLGTFSFNMGKHLGTGEGGMATINDDRIERELRRRVIFGESPPELASNYRMTEFSAAVGLAQLGKVEGYLSKYREGKKLLDEVVDGCAWLDKRVSARGSSVSPYVYAAIFRGDRKGYTIEAMRGALKACGEEDGNRFGMGFTQVPAYRYEFFRGPNAYGHKGCPYNCHLYTGKVDLSDGLCPVAEDVLPRLITASNMQPPSVMKGYARTLRKAIAMMEAGNVPAERYSRLESQVLDIVEATQPTSPAEVRRALEKKGIRKSESELESVMEHLRNTYPRKLSHAGPGRFSYHKLD